MQRINRLLALAAIAAATASCSSSDGSPAPEGSEGDAGADGAGTAPPTGVVNEAKTHAAPFVDAKFGAKTPTLLRTTAALPDLDVRALATVGVDAWIGTATGLYRVAAGESVASAVALGIAGAAVDLAPAAGSLVVATPGGVAAVAAPWALGTPLATIAGGARITSVATHGADVFVGTDQGLAKVNGSTIDAIADAQGFAVRDVAVSGDVVWMATASGIRRWDAATSALVAPVGTSLLADPDVRALAIDPATHDVLAATAGGLTRLAADGVSAKSTRAGVGALPEGDVRAVASAGGTVLLGHPIGATSLGPAGTEHFHTERWIPAEEVTAVAVADDGTRWIGTHAGASRIALVPMTLAEKADALEAQNPAHVRMDGFVDQGIRYADPWDHSGKPQTGDNDNDGLWTEMQVAAWCFAYAATHDERYYQAARRSMDVMLLQIDVPGETFAAKGLPRGYITRSLVRDDEGDVYASKAGKSNWHQQAFGGRTYYWKDDTSSDEYAGHFLGIPVFYDLCAKTDDERKQIRDRMQLVMSYVVDHGDVLVDLDGEPTSNGHWDHLADAVDGLAACLQNHGHDCAGSYGGGGWLNSIEILGHLLAAWHVTGDDRFYREYERLAIDERYGEMIPLTDHTLTVTDRSIANHSDHELASLAYFTLLRYEPNADRRAKWLKSLVDFHDREKGERNALEIAVLESADGGDGALLDAIDTLKHIPIDRRSWRFDNGYREDVTIDPQKDRFDDPQLTTVLPYDEIAAVEWNANLYAVADGDSGNTVVAAWPWLLPYWMMRYHGAIAEK